MIVHGLRGGALGGAEGQQAQRWRVFTRVAGIDMHTKQVTAAARTPGQDGGQRHQQLRRFSTFYRSLQEMAAWLRAEQTTHVAMEATGVYWRLHVVLKILTHRQVGSRHDAVGLQFGSHPDARQHQQLRGVVGTCGQDPSRSAWVSVSSLRFGLFITGWR